MRCATAVIFSTYITICLCCWFIYFILSVCHCRWCINSNFAICQCLWGTVLMLLIYLVYPQHMPLLMMYCQNNFTIRQCLWGASDRLEHISMQLLFDIFGWTYFSGSDAANKYYLPWLCHTRICSYDYHTFFYLSILIWSALEVRSSHMSWLVLGLLWYFYSSFIQMWHLPYDVTQTITYILFFLLFLMNRGTLAYAMMSYFQYQLSNHPYFMDVLTSFGSSLCWK